MSYIAKARKVVAERKGVRQNGATADYFLMTSNGEVGKNIKGACHAAVLSTPNIRYVINRINWQGTKGVDRELAIKFYDWLLNRSPFAKVFVETDAEKAWEDEYIIADGRKPSNLVQGALITSRNAWEFPDMVRRWEKLVEKGINESLAYFVSHFFGSEGDTYFLKAGFTSHLAIETPSATLEGATSYVKGVACPTLLGTPLLNNTARVRGVTGLWEFGTVVFPTYLKEELDKIGQTQAAKDCNPFRVKTKAATVTRYKFDKIVQWALTFQESM